MGTRSTLAKLSREIYPGLDVIDQNVVSLDDDNAFTGNNTHSGTNTISGLFNFNTTGGVNIAPLILTPAASVTIAKATSAGRLNLIPSTATANDEYVVPIPTVIGETYRFAWSGIAADADDVLFVAPSADAWTMTGGILYFDGDQTNADGYLMQFPGSDDDKFQITNPESFDISFTATTLTNYHLSGFAMSTDTAGITFGDL